jgi:glycosyltransferase involved in cell wall biosynthesis
MEQTKLSVITINYNNAEGLERTIASVLSQTYRSIEYIIIDGGSKDASVDIIRKNKDKICKWVSEADAGIYNAMNKGIRMSSGEYLIFLNSGDLFRDQDTLQHFMQDSGNKDIIYGDTIFRSETGERIKTHPAAISFEFFLYDNLNHQSTLIRRTLFEIVGLYDEKNKVVSDWAFFVNAICRFNASYKHVPVPIAVFYQDGLSSSPENDKLIHREKETFLSDHYQAFLPDYKRLDEYRSALNLVRLSRLHRIAEMISGSRFYKFIAGK